jgi:hypothetical protein
MIMDVAPAVSESVAVWMRSGFNTSNAVWRFELKDKHIKVKLFHPVNSDPDDKCRQSAYELDTDNEPWRLPFDTIWEVIPGACQKLKYIYIFSNTPDNQAVSSLHDIDTLLNRCLNNLDEIGVRSVAMILIPSADQSDRISARRMISAIQKWLNLNNSDMNIYLVDRADDFAPLIREINNGLD